MATRVTPSVDEAVQTYLASRKRRLKPNSLIRERDILLRFARFVGPKQVGRLTDKDYEGFYDACADGTAPGSRKPLGSAALRQVRLRLIWFSDYCAAKGWHKPGLTAFIDKPVEDMPRDFCRLTIADMEKALDSCTRPRDRMLIAMACFSGLRSQTITALKVSDFDLDHENRTGTIRVQIFKSNKVRFIAISPDLYDEVIRWTAAYENECGEIESSWYFIPGNKKNRFSYESGQRESVPGNLVPTTVCGRPHEIAHSILDNLGLDKENEGMHTFRRSYARNLYDRLVADGVADPMKVVSDALHHSTVQVTERYIGTDYGAQRKDDIVRSLSFRQPQAENVTVIAPPVREAM